jgi:hypothetical protein
VRGEQVRILAGTDDPKTMKNTRWALLKNPWNLTAAKGTSLSRSSESTDRATARTCSTSRFHAIAYVLRQLPACVSRALAEALSRDLSPGSGTMYVDDVSIR